MKRVVIFSLLLFSVLGLAGCNDYQRGGMVSEEKGRYALYVVGDDQVDMKLEKELVGNSVFRTITDSDYDNVKEDTPYLEIQKDKPNYFLFNTKDLVYQTTSYEKLVKYLEDNPKPK